MNSEILNKAEKFVYRFYQDSNTEKLLYHDLVHTVDVVSSTQEIAAGTELTDDETEIVLLAAWFHDLGYTKSRQDHEKASCEIAEAFLSENNYPSEKTAKVKSCIMTTIPSQLPENKLEEVVCDADFLHLAKKDFAERSELLKTEIEMSEKRTIGPKEWYELTTKVITEHKYYTQYAREKYSEKKRENIVKLQKKMKKTDIESKSNKLKEEKLLFEKEKLKDKKKNSNKADRGIETMFRNVIRTHVEFSGMADSKANIMISVNTLILTAVAAILSSKLDSNPHLIIPTAVLTFASLSTLIFAIIVTRPKITAGTFTEDDIKKKKANLLFFGNFYKMKLDKFTWGMKEMMNDKEYLYGSMTMDFYYLGQVLGRKYKYLNICYTIFLVGMIISVIVFGVAVLLTPEATNIGSIID